MNIAFVIQRYGLEVNGGAELHCRWLAERLASHHKVEVFATCALDYIYWKNHYRPGWDVVNGIKVKRFKVRRTRNIRRFSSLSDLVFYDAHTLEEEREWIKANGPYCPKLIRHIVKNSRKYDFFVFYCYRYYQTYFGLQKVPQKSILIPTAEEDAAVQMKIFREFFSLPAGIVYLTPEEKELIVDAFDNASVPSVVIGSGVEAPSGITPLNIRKNYDVKGPLLLYVGRIDKNKGCDRLFSFFQRFLQETGMDATLVLVGRNVIDIPGHPRIIHLGFLNEQEKFGALSECDLLVMPSRYESLSVITLEAWSLSKPVLADARCRVLKGQCIRSNGGLFYRGYADFAESLKLLAENPDLRKRLGRQGNEYFNRNYKWAEIEKTMNDFLNQLKERSGRDDRHE